jgi:small subunit ribosomal protein S5
MEPDKLQNNETEQEVKEANQEAASPDISANVSADVSSSVSTESVSQAPQGDRRYQRNTREPRAKNDRKPRREPRAKPEFDQKIISIRRVTRVASGGRRFSFSVAIVAGNRKGKVGVGTGKAGDTSLAIDKALKNARKNMIDVPVTKDMSIPHEVQAKYCTARVEMMPARGRGVAAGSSVRDVIELAGIRDITAKLHSGSKNKLNNARVAIKALGMLKQRGGKAGAEAVASPVAPQMPVEQVMAS